jgi:predicted signal transduction protein with EAL and GGDEF domain
MRRYLPQPHLDLSSDQPPGELLKVGGNGQRLPGAAEVASHQPCIALPARAEELRRLLGASIDENGQLTDPLTGLANRRSFDLELRAVGARASRSSPAQLVMADIDHFKRVNDSHCRPGDAVATGAW